ncbi:MAG: LolA family protein [Hydrogenobaculum sp.]|nr:MAG: outer membrane lipoprotein carrier protein LolA [Hydrogenobaculum sp.]
MRFKYKYMLAVIFTVSLAFGGIVDKFLNKIKHMELIKISFQQKFYPIGYAKPITSYGEAYIQNKSPFKIKLVYEKPNKFVILYNGKNTILYNKSSNYTYDVKGKNEEIKGISILNKDITTVFRPILTSYQNGYYDILFIPKSKIVKDVSYVILRLTRNLTPESFYVYMPQKGVLYIKVLSFSSEKNNEDLFNIK